jgi:hypothetical protein
LHGKLITIAPVHGARINGLRSKALIREESENDAFHSPRSKKPLTDFLRQITTIREGSGNDAFRFPMSKTLTDFLRPYQ